MAQAQKITPRAQDYSAWYNDVIMQAELADYSPVRGCMVIRPNRYGIWELRTRLCLRTTEFLWQERHTAHVDEADAERETRTILGLYRRFAEEWLAMPVITGVKTDGEKFAGALRTYAIEALMQDNKALQAGTAHNLRQNFAKAFNGQYQTAAR